MKRACIIIYIALPFCLFAQKNDSALLLQAKKLYDASKDDSATILLNAILLKKNAHTILSEAENLLGHIELNKGNLPNALSHYIQSEKIGIANNDINVSTQAAIHISGIYREQNNLPKARMYIDKAEQTINNVNSKKITASFFNNKAILLEMTNQFDSAIDTYNKALDIYIAENDSNHIAIGYNNLGIVYKNKGNYEKAYENYKKVVDIEKKIGNKYILAASYINMGNTDYKMKKYDDAISYNKLGLLIAKEIPAQYLIVSAAENIAQSFFDKGMADSAYTWQKIKFDENEKYLNAENSKQINEMQTKYETEKKESTIALQQSKLSRQKLLIIGSSTLFGLLLLYGYSGYRRYKLKKENELQEKLFLQREDAAINILNAEENERRRIASDLHDGVGQMMTAAWLNLQVVEKQLKAANIDQQDLINKATKLVGESCKEVRQVSHDMMPNALVKKGLINALKEFTQQVDKSVILIRLQADDTNERFNNTTETILYRVIQECVNNAIKHAEASELDISVQSENEELNVLIEDNGKGFDVTKINDNENGLGLQNIRSRISFLKGTVDWDSSPGNGTVVAIHIPLSK